MHEVGSSPRKLVLNNKNSQLQCTMFCFSHFFNKLKLEDFQCAEMKAFPSLAMNAMTVVLPFSTTYFCESGFSTMMCIKNKHRNRLQLEDDLRIVWSKTESSLERILKIKQQ